MDAPVPGTIGKLMPSVEGAVVDLDLARRAAPGETGMLLVRGPSVFGGYLHYAGESPFVTFDGQSWYRTGDLVAMDADGRVTFKGGSSVSSSSAARWSRCRRSRLCSNGISARPTMGR